jgi:ketosteroid isomerase-like protein
VIMAAGKKGSGAMRAVTLGLAIGMSNATWNASPAGEEAPRSTVEAATAAFHQALRTNDADALFAYVADDVVMMPPGEEVIRGKAAMRAWYAAFLAQFRTSALTLTGRETLGGDGWAVEMGTYEWSLAPVDGGRSVVDCGSYMQVWKSQPDGQWRFAREIWNSSAPARK